MNLRAWGVPGLVERASPAQLYSSGMRRRGGGNASNCSLQSLGPANGRFRSITGHLSCRPTIARNGNGWPFEGRQLPGNRHRRAVVPATSQDALSIDWLDYGHKQEDPLPAVQPAPPISQHRLFIKPCSDAAYSRCRAGRSSSRSYVTGIAGRPRLPDTPIATPFANGGGTARVASGGSPTPVCRSRPSRAASFAEASSRTRWRSYRPPSCGSLF